jgi:hypothetical protein
MNLVRRTFYPTLLLVACMAFFGVDVRGRSDKPSAEIAADHALIEDWAKDQFSVVFY